MSFKTLSEKDRCNFILLIGKCSSRAHQLQIWSHESVPGANQTKWLCGAINQCWKITQLSDANCGYQLTSCFFLETGCSEGKDNQWADHIPLLMKGLNQAVPQALSEWLKLGNTPGHQEPLWVASTRISPCKLNGCSNPALNLLRETPPCPGLHGGSYPNRWHGEWWFSLHFCLYVLNVTPKQFYEGKHVDHQEYLQDCTYSC